MEKFAFTPDLPEEASDGDDAERVAVLTPEQVDQGLRGVEAKTLVLQQGAKERFAYYAPVAGKGRLVSMALALSAILNGCNKASDQTKPLEKAAPNIMAVESQPVKVEAPTMTAREWLENRDQSKSYDGRPVFSLGESKIVAGGVLNREVTPEIYENIQEILVRPGLTEETKKALIIIEIGKGKSPERDSN